MTLFERYRPAKWDDVLGQPKALAALCRLRNNGGLGGRAYWISGSSGTGKTTIARLLAGEMAEAWNIEEMDAGKLSAERIDEIERSMNHLGMGQKIGRAFIFNEAHGLNRVQIRRLLSLIEPEGGLPAHVVIIFTTTKAGQESLFEDYDDAGPLLGRCVAIKLTNQGLAKPFAERAKAIAEQEQLDGKPIGDYIRLAQRCNNSLRAMLSAIEAGEMVAD